MGGVGGVLGNQGRRSRKICVWLTGEKSVVKRVFFLLFNPITDQGEYYWLSILPEELKNAFLSPNFFSLVSENVSKCQGI